MLEQETTLQTLKRDLRARIAADPTRSFFVGIGIGMAVILFSKILIPLALVALLVAAVLYFVKEDKS